MIITATLTLSFVVITKWAQLYKKNSRIVSLTVFAKDRAVNLGTVGSVGASDLKTIATSLPGNNVSLVKFKIMCA